MSLYHYTNENGFKGIVLNNLMRLTLSTQSNDKKDTIQIYDLIKENKEKFYKKDNRQYNIMIDELLNSFNKFEERIKDNNFKNKVEKPFVICFTSKKDDKDMWEGYNKNLGYCIGIDEEKLQLYAKTYQFQKEICKNAKKYYIMQVIYDKETQINIIKQTIEDEYNKFLNNKNEELCKHIQPITFSYNFKFILHDDINGEDYVDETKPMIQTVALKQKFIDLVFSIYSSLLLIAPLIKNPYWESENETRLAFIRMLKDDDLENIKIDEKGRYYLNFEIDKSIINEIVIAPLNDKSIEEVKEELIKAGYDINKVNVKYSSGKDVLRDR
ncbi:DUF2971 domain-containing protein [Clostridium sp. 3-3]|uniref:DUF2971 domain-containing protein n=1 Tax=Clostridium sp. 3-3 TaxID=2070757 RepID=UPI000CDA5165|nr:DUF2971 domain-containing protein [Clostridium sp. 3-3]POO86639.1 hypothetical protein C1H59_09595 [Clostridium sp. 3-3]